MSYLAGFFDGEGCIGIYKTSGSRDPRYKSGFKTASWVRNVSLVNSYLPYLRAVQEEYGGRIHRIVKAKRYKPCYQWIIGSKDSIIKFLTDIGPHLLDKKDQAYMMIDECKGNLKTTSAARYLKRAKRRRYVA